MIFWYADRKTHPIVIWTTRLRRRDRPAPERASAAMLLQSGRPGPSTPLANQALAMDWTRRSGAAPRPIGTTRDQRLGWAGNTLLLAVR